MFLLLWGAQILNLKVTSLHPLLCRFPEISGCQSRQGMTLFILLRLYFSVLCGTQECYKSFRATLRRLKSLSACDSARFWSELQSLGTDLYRIWVPNFCERLCQLSSGTSAIPMSHTHLCTSPQGPRHSSCRFLEHFQAFWQPLWTIKRVRPAPCQAQHACSQSSCPYSPHSMLAAHLWSSAWNYQA